MCCKSSIELDENPIFSISEQLGIKRVSIQELRKCSGYEDVTDEEAERIIESIYQLSLLTYQIAKQNERIRSI